VPVPDEIQLSIVLPCYNASRLLERRLPPFLGCLDKLETPYEVILSDDGSADAADTCRIAKQFGCRYIAGARNLGKGAAVRRGMRAARGKFRIFTDADIPYEFDIIERMLRCLDFEQIHFVAGNRHFQGSNYFAEIPAIRRIASRVYSFIVARFIAAGWRDTQCGIKGFRAEAADRIFNLSRVNRFAFDAEIFHIALKLNYGIKRLPVHLKRHDKSSVRIVRDSLLMFKDLAAIQWHDFAGHYGRGGSALIGPGKLRRPGGPWNRVKP